MLQNVEKQRLDYVSEHIKRLGLRFPVADIAQKTKFSKGQVSRMLSGKIPISDNFLEMFNKSYNIVAGDKQPKPLDGTTAALRALVLVVAEHEAKLTGMSYTDAVLRIEQLIQSAAGHTTPVITLKHYATGERGRMDERIKRVRNEF